MKHFVSFVDLPWDLQIHQHQGNHEHQEHPAQRGV